MTIALSWSRLSVYRQCPKQFEAKYLTKTYPDESDNPAFEKGTRIHKQLEDYINWKKLPLKTRPEEPKLCDEAHNAKRIIDSYFNRYPPEQIFAEKQLALTKDWKVTGWFDHNVAWRGIVDMVVFPSQTQVAVIDFKSGKYREYDADFGQLHLTAAYMFELFPDLKRVTCAYLFVEHKKTIKVSFNREEAKALRAHFDIEYIRINEEKEFEPKKNAYCYFCGIKKECKYG